MNFKRAIYLLLSVSPFILCAVLAKDSKDIIPLIIFMIGLLSIIEYVINLFFTRFTSLTFLFGLVSLLFKKIYYSDIGHFYSYKFNDKIYIMRQRIFHIEVLFSERYNGDIEELKSSIKYRLDDTYRSEIYEAKKKAKEIERNKELKRSYKNWDGTIDLESKRDQKIKKLLN